VELAQAVVLPVIVPGFGSELITLTAMVLLLLPQPFMALTTILPLLALVVAVIEVPPPVVLVIFQPEGTVQLYDVAPGTDAIL
jgi:hypothetical protein